MKKFIDPLHIPPYLLLPRANDDDARYIGKHDFRSVLLHSISSNANLHMRTQSYREVRPCQYPQHIGFCYQLKITSRVCCKGSFLCIFFSSMNVTSTIDRLSYFFLSHLNHFFVLWYVPFLNTTHL